MLICIGTFFFFFYIVCFQLCSVNARDTKFPYVWFYRFAVRRFNKEGEAYFLLQWDGPTQGRDGQLLLWEFTENNFQKHWEYKSKWVTFMYFSIRWIIWSYNERQSHLCRYLSSNWFMLKWDSKWLLVADWKKLQQFFVFLWFVSQNMVKSLW